MIVATHTHSRYYFDTCFHLYRSLVVAMGEVEGGRYQ